MKICVFGGSFDPLHNGHLEILKHLDSENFDLILLVPAFLSPFKTKSFFSAKQRLEMCKNAAEKFKNVQVCDFEIKQNRATCTIDTINFVANFAKSLDSETAQITLAMGLDSFLEFHKWKDFEKILTMCDLLVFGRKILGCENQLNLFAAQVSRLDSQKCRFVPFHSNISSTQIRKNLQA